MFHVYFGGNCFGTLTHFRVNWEQRGEGRPNIVMLSALFHQELAGKFGIYVIITELRNLEHYWEA